MLPVQGPGPSGLVLSGRLVRGRRISGLISFEPDRAEVYLDGTRQRWSQARL